MSKFYNLTIHKYKSSHKLIKHLNPTKHIQICEKINKSHVQKINGGIRKNHNHCGSKTSNLEDFDGKSKEKESKHGRRILIRRRSTYNRIVVQYLEHIVDYHLIIHEIF
jgi:hypothetical protein